MCIEIDPFHRIHFDLSQQESYINNDGTVEVTKLQPLTTFCILGSLFSAAYYYTFGASVSMKRDSSADTISCFVHQAVLVSIN